MRRIRAYSALLVVLAVPRALPAQYLPRHVQSTVPAEPQQVADTRIPVEDAVLSTIGGALGGVAGFYGLGLVGFHLTGGGEICGDDPCGFLGGIFGALLGEAIGIGLGAHLGGGAKGEPLAPIAASLGVLIAGGMVAQHLNPGESMIVVIPVAQVATAVWAELSTARRKSRGAGVR
jgi:hypothetical protein